MCRWWAVDHWREGLQRQKRWAGERRIVDPLVLSHLVEIARAGREGDLDVHEGPQDVLLQDHCCVIRHLASEALWIQKLPQ